MNTQLIRKYNIPGPRYTSYPTVPYWDNSPTQKEWADHVKQAFDHSNGCNGISLYIHLPFCERLCTYCGCNTRITVNHKVEEPYIETLLKEWQLYLTAFEAPPNISEIHLGGGTPTFFSAKNLKRLIDGITDQATLIPEAELSIEGHPGNTTIEHLQILYQLGFRRLSLGIQDFDPRVQEVINRKQSFEEVKLVTDNARDIGFTSINFDLIYGLPLQTKSSVATTIEKVQKLRPDRIAFYSYAHVPWLKPAQRVFEEGLPADEEKRALYELGKNLFETAGYAEIGMDHFALPSDPLYKAFQSKKLHRNFMGYTSNYTRLMVGLGASSISDSWTGFVQNIKKVEDYTAAVNQGLFPFFRGHQLNKEDLVLRTHILNIMCHFETSWYDDAYQTEALYRGIDKLWALKNDGLIVLNPFHLEVTEGGKPFVRNICMSFDARLWRNSPDTSIFSQTV